MTAPDPVVVLAHGVVAAIVLGHVLGAVLAHDRACGCCRPGRARTS